MMFRGFKVKECSTGLCLISSNVVAYCLTHPLSPSLLTAWLSGLLITEGAALEAGAREGVCACVRVCVCVYVRVCVRVRERERERERCCGGWYASGMGRPLRAYI